MQWGGVELVRASYVAEVERGSSWLGCHWLRTPLAGKVELKEGIPIYWPGKIRCARVGLSGGATSDLGARVIAVKRRIGSVEPAGEGARRGAGGGREASTGLGKEDRVSGWRCTRRAIG